MRRDDIRILFELEIHQDEALNIYDDCGEDAYIVLNTLSLN